MVTTNENGKDEKNWYSIHSHRSRLFIYSPEPDFFIYMVSLGAPGRVILIWLQNVTLALNPPAPPQTASSSSSSSSKSPAEPFATTAQGLSDRIIVDALSRGYEDFRVRLTLSRSRDR